MKKRAWMRIPHITPLPFFLTLSSIVVFGCIIQNTLTIGQSLIYTQNELASTTKAWTQLSQEFSAMKTLNGSLYEELNKESIRNSQFSEQISSINATVGQLYKLSQTDKELLQKYSNVYFLNENYIPASLSDIDSTYLFRKDKPEKIHTTIKIFLETLLKNAESDGVKLRVLSAYRSFGTQANLKTIYKIQYGTSAANKFSADQGYSEHQLGSTVDFTTDTTGENLNAFEKTPAYTWLLSHAHQYGFILSYPEGNTFFQFEPWHWRFVGVELATKIHNENKYFYGLDQREINTYLGKIFDLTF